MATQRERAAQRVELERGALSVWYRPRVEAQQPGGLEDVQRILLFLEPRRAMARLLAIGRKRLPPAGRHERFWGFVDLVLPPRDVRTVLGPQIYGTKTRGLRHLPAAEWAASGEYTLEHHDGHAHLAWELRSLAEEDPIARQMRLERQADYIVTVANPDPAVWGLLEPPDLQSELFDDLEVHVTIPTPFPPRLQARFRGRKYAQIDETEWLDHPGAEIVFVGAD